MAFVQKMALKENIMRLLSIFNVFLLFLFSSCNQYAIVTEAVVITSDLEQSEEEDAFYPYGNKFPLALYAINDGFDLVVGQGWNIAHTYQPPPTKVPYTNAANNAGMLVMGRLSVIRQPDLQYYSEEEDVVKADIDTLNATGGIAWWDLPEEQRYWRVSEVEVLQNYTSWTRKYDPEKKPNFMYLPGHYKVEDLQKYVSYLDILPASCYSNYMNSPASYLRWSIERTFEAIENENYTLGKDYLNNEKTVMAILELYSAGVSTMSPEQSYHDFWLALACDVKGILVYSYAYRNAHPTLNACWESLNLAVNRFTGVERLDRVAIEGETIHGVNFVITSGPQRTPTFLSYQQVYVDYPSIKVLTKKRGDYIYVIAVNSSTELIEVSIDGIPSQSSSGEVLFESRNITLNSGVFSDSFEGYGVHVYKIPATN